MKSDYSRLKFTSSCFEDSSLDAMNIQIATMIKHDQNAREE